jgi:hypothetical protein
MDLTVEILDPIGSRYEDQRDVLTTQACEFLHALHRSRCRRAARIPFRHRVDPEIFLDGRTHSCGTARPARGDHRTNRAQNGDQCAKFRGQGVHGGF